MKRVMPFVVLLIVFMMLMVVMGSFKKEAAKVPERPVGFLVETQPLKRQNLVMTVNSQGTVKAKREIALKTEIAGKVLDMNPIFAAGGQFKKGDVLITIDPADYQVAVKQAQAALASAIANKDLEQARSDQALKDWQSFGKKGKPSDLVLNIPQLNGAKAQVKAAEAELAKAERNLSKTKITAPFDGTVFSKDVDLGQFVGVAATLGMIAGTEVAEVRLPLTQRDIDKLAIGHGDLTEQPWVVHFKNETQTVDGHLVRLEAAKDPNTLMHYAVAEIESPLSADLFFNSFVSATIEGQSLNNVFAVPSAWMMANNQVPIYREGELDILDVTVVHKTDDFFYVSTGLNEQSQVITTPIQAPSRGMKLRLNSKKEAEPANDLAEAKS